MSLDALLKSRMAKLATKPKPVVGHVCRCGKEATWKCAADVWRCTRCEKLRLAAELRLPPAIHLED
jgi:ribosomal protein L37AE/L43A